MLKQPAFFLDTQLCIGCKTCMIACKDKNDLPLGVRWRRVIEFSGGDWFCLPDGTYRQNVFTYYLSVSCGHCQKPICVESCPSGAMNQDELGIVSVNKQMCLGCRMCEWSCPYSAPQYNEITSLMTKCDFCRDQLIEDNVPACVAACPTRALTFGDYDDLVSRFGNCSRQAPLPDPEMTMPRLIFTSHRDSKAMQVKEGFIVNPEEVRDE